MVCCALLATLIGSVFWVFRKFNQIGTRVTHSPLEWQLEGAIPSSVTRQSSFSFRARVKSFSYAFYGLSAMIKSEHNAWVHLAGTLIILIVSLLLEISFADWRWICIAIALVWFAEAINTAIEHLCDVISPGFHEGIKASKDIAAGAVLTCALLAIVIGAATLLPYLENFLNKPFYTIDICRNIQ